MVLKFKEPFVIKATYRIVTPMFIGDANQAASDISPASVKGALRFWWRALNWGRIRSAAGVNTDNAALLQLHEEEGALFGSTDNSSDQKGKAARFSLRVVYKCETERLDTKSNGVQYLLGQGLYRFKKGCLRSSLRADSNFQVEIVFHDDNADSELQKKQLESTLMLFGLLGGLGSRARKGFGSISIQELIVDGTPAYIPLNLSEFQNVFSAYELHHQLPPFTAFSSQSRIDISLQGCDAMTLLDKAGEELQLYRSWGKSMNGEHKVAGKLAEQNFKADHDLMYSVIHTGKNVADIPKRSIFGLPHNYFFSSTNKKSDFSCAEKDRSRRASPLFLHVHQFPNGETVLIQMLFPALFLNEGEKLEFKIGQRKKTTLFKGRQMVDWSVILDYLDRYEEKVSVL